MARLIQTIPFILIKIMILDLYKLENTLINLLTKL